MTTLKFKSSINLLNARVVNGFYSNRLYSWKNNLLKQPKLTFLKKSLIILIYLKIAYFKVKDNLII